MRNPRVKSLENVCVNIREAVRDITDRRHQVSQVEIFPGIWRIYRKIIVPMGFTRLDESDKAEEDSGFQWTRTHHR